MRIGYDFNQCRFSTIQRLLYCRADHIRFLYCIPNIPNDFATSAKLIGLNRTIFKPFSSLPDQSRNGRSTHPKNTIVIYHCDGVNPKLHCGFHFAQVIIKSTITSKTDNWSVRSSTFGTQRTRKCPSKGPGCPLIFLDCFHSYHSCTPHGSPNCIRNHYCVIR